MTLVSKLSEFLFLVLSILGVVAPSHGEHWMQIQVLSTRLRLVHNRCAPFADRMILSVVLSLLPLASCVLADSDPLQWQNSTSSAGSFPACGKLNQRKSW